MYTGGFRKKVYNTPVGDVEVGDSFDMEEAVDLFTDAYMYDDWSKRTLKFHLENLAAFKKFLLTRQKGARVSSRLLGDFIGEMRKNGRKLNTINGRIKTLRVFFRVLCEKEYIGKNPAENLRTIKGAGSEIIPFSQEQVKALLAAPDKNTFVGLRDYMIMLILLDTGVRLDELVHVRPSDISLNSKSIFIRSGKGKKSRTVYFGAETRKAIQKYLKYIGIRDEERPLLLNQDGQPLRPRTIQERIAEYAKNAQIKGVRCSPHTFRHTFSKMFLMGGGDPYVLRDLLGHSTMSTVITYIKLFREDLQKKYRGNSPVDKLRTGSRDDGSRD
ncbi:tyrosine-type recombinase/integrase [Desulforamulus ruminis]|uniref:tyrosine-type recombinase/integrase n=1 Tax=Desulforamulus ruminis TaxID=1564 RepID=UPI002FDA1931